ncbi:hybrid sensor histidine kinase/response regulator [Shewanella sp. NIFS-20-20]|uniref:hybrid sensor histidine kinase/response regulator n=1 Tax=Shewanella sp. NIFS-20-20 TaxID=2853806 RepID=UPI001C46994F|nr:hybrid sensor histidine kinase/response regulator [Shewanella sp. NIFS-20-20]MBV7316075.1 response regulator [Shewanella sp. NIFS-20-20]
MGSIRTVFVVLSTLIATLIITLSVLFYQVHTSADNLDEQVTTIHDRIMLAHEVKQSSDHLTKFARAYAATGNPKWKQLFNRVLAVRNGLAPIPPGNNFEYWDVTSDPNELLVPFNNSNQAFPSLLERMQIAGITPTQLLLLRQAINMSENLVNLEREAFDAIEGIKRTEAGIVSIEPNPQQAIDILFSNAYFQEKRKIMTPVGQFYRLLSESTQAELHQSQTKIHTLYDYQIIALTMLSIIAIASFILLWTYVLSPAYRMQRKLVNQVNNHDFGFQITEHNKGALRPLARAQNLILQEVSQQLQMNSSIKEFTDVMRDSADANELGGNVINFLAERFEIPLIGIYKFYDNQLTRVAGCGYSSSSSQTIADRDSIQISLLRSRSHFSLRDLDGKYRIPLLDGELSLAELHFFPLKVNDNIVGLLELGLTSPLAEAHLIWLNKVQDDLAINFELTRNSELQAAAERRIAEQLEFNQQVLNAIPSPMYFRDSNGRYLGVNNGFSDFLGLFEADILDCTPADLFPAETSQIFNNAEKTLLQAPGTTQYDLNLKNAENEQRHISIFEATYYSSKGDPKGIVGLFVDVTEQKELEIELRGAKDAADEASKAKGEFLANMSHEIRTPMNAIIGMSHLALHSGLSDKQHHYVSKIDHAAKSLLGIINDILDFSKVEAGKLSIENIDFLLDEVLDNLANVIGMKADDKHLEFLFDIDPHLPSALVGDPLRLGQVLINLCGNSIKFTEKGEIIVKVKQLESSDDDNIIIQFEIIDSGIGMSEEQLGRLFKSFSQADGSITRKYGGTGLGLTISKSLVELMGGNIWVKSEPGKGSVFGFTIEAGLQDVKARKFYQPVDDLQAKRVLVVDDNDAAREIMMGLLKAMNFRVMTVSNGFEAVTAVEKGINELDPFDVVFMDWMLPGIDGIETTKQIRDKISEDKLPKFIMVTAYGREVGLSGENEKLFDGLVIKPVNPSLIFDAIMNAFGVMKKTEALEARRSEPEQSDFSIIKNANVLLVEDNETNQEVAIGILEPYGPNIKVANNGQEALDWLEKQNFQLVLMDMQMPVMDGITATKHIRNTLKSAIPIVAMTANAMSQDVENCKAAGMNDHLGKPINVNELLKKMCRWLSEGAAGVANVAPSTECLLDSQAEQDEQVVGGITVIEIADEVEDDICDFFDNSETSTTIIDADSDESMPEIIHLNQTEDAYTEEMDHHLNNNGMPAGGGILNIDDGIGRLGGNEKLYWQIVSSFINSRQQEEQKLHQAVADADWEFIGRVGHTIKGAAANISADNLAIIGKELEDLGHNKTAPSAEFLQQLSDMLNQLQQEVIDFGPKEEVVKPQSSEVKSYDTTELMIELQQLQMLLDNFDTQAIDFIAVMKQNAEAINALGIDFAALEKAIAEFNFSAAQEELNKLIEKSKSA